MYTYGQQYLDEDDINAVESVLRSRTLTQGRVVENFEAELSKKLGAAHTCVTSNGSSALHLIGRALGWKADDVILTSPITFLASANCILYCGASLDLADIDPRTYTIDPNQVEDRIKFHRKLSHKVKAVIGVDFAGHPADWEDLRSLADRYELNLVNDHCHALGAAYKDQTDYAAQYADAVSLSFHPVKHITTGEGGAVITNDKSVDKIVRLLRSHGVSKDPNQISASPGPWYYEMVELGYNYRITDIQCALGLSQLSKLDRFVTRRREIANRYRKRLNQSKLFVVPFEEKSVRHAYHLYTLLVDFDKTTFDRRQLFETMELAGVKLQVHYIPLHYQPYYKSRCRFNENGYPVAERYYRQAMSLPMYPQLTDEDIDIVCGVLMKSLGFV